MKWAMMCLAAGLAMPASAADIVERIKTVPPGRILAGAKVQANAEIFHLSGQVPAPIDASKPADNLAAFGDTYIQTISTLTKIKALLEANGYAMTDVFKMTAYLAAPPGGNGRMDFDGFNKGFEQFFGSGKGQITVARSTLQVVALAGPHYLVELEVTAARETPARR
jgi:2-iminobutanoate/2-iminopropanoate deaminase